MASNIQYRIGFASALLMITVAIMFDVVEGLLTLTGMGAVIQSLIAPVAGGTFALWLYILGVGLLSPRKFILAFASFIIETFPGTGWLPMWTIGIAVMIYMVRLEDRTGKSLIPLNTKSKLSARTN